MKRVLTAAVLIPLVLLAVFRAPTWLLMLLTVTVALLAAFEYLGIAAAYGFEPFRLLTYINTAALFVVTYYAEALSGGTLVAPGLLLLLILCPFVLLIGSLGREDLRSALPSASVSFMALPYIGIPMLLLVLLRDTPFGWVPVLFTFFAVWVGDTAAYYVGKNFGRHQLAPRVSPGKTIEGAIASLVFAVIVCCAFGYFLPEIASGLTRIHVLPTDTGMPPLTARASMWTAVVLAAIINVAAQVGDLAESAMKRGAGVKDSGTLLPGHGGILDRIDALLFALPVAFIAFLVVGQKFLQS